MKVLDNSTVSSRRKMVHSYPLIMPREYTDIIPRWGTGYLMMQYPTIFKSDYEDDWFRIFYYYSLEAHGGVEYANQRVQ
jgi:hypothetical protein